MEREREQLNHWSHNTGYEKCSPISFVLNCVCFTMLTVVGVRNSSEISIILNMQFLLPTRKNNLPV